MRSKKSIKNKNALLLLICFFSQMIFVSCFREHEISYRNLLTENASLYLLNFSAADVTLTLDGKEKNFCKNSQDFSKIDDLKKQAFDPDFYIYFYDDFENLIQGFNLTEEDKICDMLLNEKHVVGLTSSGKELYSFDFVIDKSKITLECYFDYPSLLEKYMKKGNFIFSSRPGDFLLVECKEKERRGDWIAPKFIIVIAPENTQIPAN